MNNDIIPLGPQETVNGGTVEGKILVFKAVDAVTVSNVVYTYEKTPPHANKITSFDLPVGGRLFRIKSITFTGAATITYLV